MSHDSATVAPDTIAASDKAPDESSKIKTFLTILRKFIGVADIATVRFSLPAQLLEPIPNLEFWNYLDHPQSFISIGKSDDELGRMLEVLRFWFSKDLKYVKGKPVKPYNSVLGEFFRCNWEVEDSEPSIMASSSSSSTEGAVGVPDGVHKGEKVKISYLTEQTSHHPPVSAYYIDCPERGIVARGFDQISAKFTGTSIRITPGQHNQGIFIRLTNRGDEEYQLTHPPAHVGGLLRGSLSVTVSDANYVTCRKSRMKAILHYVEEGWLGKTHHKVVGVVFRYDPDNDCLTKVKDVPSSDILAEIDGSWHGQIFYKLAGKTDKHLLIDVVPLYPAAKNIPSEKEQLPNESRRLWSGITTAIHNRQFALATKLKHDLEESQRQKVAIRKEKNKTWRPRFFTVPITHSGKPELTPDGERTLAKIHSDSFELEESGEFEEENTTRDT